MATFNWSQGELDVAKNFFGANPTGDQIAQAAKTYGFSSDQLADLYSKSTGGSYDTAMSTINNWQQSTGNTLAGTYQPQGVQGATYVNGTPVLGAVDQYNQTKAAVTTPISATPTYTAPTTARAPVYSQQNNNWNNAQLQAASDFFNANPTGETIYQKAQNYGFNAEQLADLYSRTKGVDYSSALGEINKWLQGNGTTLNGWYKPNLAADPAATGYNPIAGTMLNPAGTVNLARTEDWAISPLQTVQGQLKGLLADDNPLVQIARTQGLEAANQRGLLNSSLGAEAGALAHYQYAMPISQADATTYASAARQNASDRTNVNLSNAGALNARSNLDQNFQNSMETIAVNAKNELDRMDAANKNAIDLLNPQYAQQARTNYTTSLTAAMQQYQTFVNQIQASDIPPEAKTTQIDQAQVSYNNTVGFMNAMYEQLPNWSKEWSLIPA